MQDHRPLIIPRPDQEELTDFDRCTICNILWLSVSLWFLGMGIFFQVHVCSGYTNWVDVHCNTTSFRIQETPFVGISGYATVAYLNGTCQSPEFEVFSCTDLDTLTSCVAAGRLNFNTPGAIWSCYLETAHCDTQNNPPAIHRPSNSGQSGCSMAYTFMILGGVMSFTATAMLMSIQTNGFDCLK